MLRKGHIETGARTSYALLENTQKAFGTVIFMQASSSEWTPHKHGQQLQRSLQTFGLGMTAVHGHSRAQGGCPHMVTQPGAQHLLAMQCEMFLCQWNPAAILPTLQRSFARGTHGSVLESFWGWEKMLRNRNQFWSTVSDLDNKLLGQCFYWKSSNKSWPGEATLEESSCLLFNEVTVCPNMPVYHQVP